MAGSSGYENLHSESDVNHAISDRDPLLNERPGAVLLTSQDHTVVHIPADTEPSDEEQYQTLLSQSHQRSTSDTDVAVVVPFDSSRSTHVTGPQSPSSVALRNISDSGVDEFSDSGNGYGSRHRTNPLNSGLWILMELTITVSQIVASVIVLALSRHEKPQAPLHVWVVGYAVGCFATLPLLYWRYRHRYFHIPPEHDFISGHPSAPLPVGVSTVPHFSQAEDSVGVFQSSLGGQDAASFDNRMNIFVERFKMALDCFFAIWFVVGNVWIFGGHSSSSEAPNLYRLCIVFLTFSCIGYAMPFILCATICCCLPCIISLLGFREDQAQTKGASSEVINSLPTYKFKGKNSCKVAELVDDVESDSDSICEGGFIAAGTENERAVSGDDAICCICLHKYKNDVELRELPCSHHFHVECVDKWLKINATCPLCKHEIGDSSDTGPETVATVTDRAFQSNAV